MPRAVDLPYRPRRSVNAVSRISRGCTPGDAKKDREKDKEPQPL